MSKAPSSYGKNALLGVILSGGASRRMGVDKATLHVAGRALWRQVADRLEPQVDQLVISTSQAQSAAVFAPFSCISDERCDQGPLAGILSVLESPGAHAFEWVAFSSCDTPLQPKDWVAWLCQHHAARPSIYYLRYLGNNHYLHSLWHRSMVTPLRDFLHSGERAVKAFYAHNSAQSVEYPAQPNAPEDPFINLNTPADIARLTHV